MNILSVLIRHPRTTFSYAFCPVLLTVAMLGFAPRAPSQTVKFVAPQRLTNADSQPVGAYKAFAGRFHTGARVDIAFTGITFAFLGPREFHDVALNQGAGSFNVIASNPGVDGNVNPGPDLAADFNRDGLTDLVSLASGGFWLQLANGDGTFTAGELVPVDTFNSDVTAVVAADFDRNGTMDLAALTSRNTVVILLNDGHGVFHAAFTYPAPSAVATFGGSLAAGDINGDTLPDLVVLAGTTVTPYISTHGGALAKGATYNVAAGSGAAEIKDVNGDGHGDVVFLSRTGIGILLGSSSGQLTAGKSVSVPGASLLVVADVNKDGRMDLVVAGSDSVVKVYFGNGNGTFKTPTTYGVGNGNTSLIAGDFYGKGNVDLATLDDGDAGLTLLKNLGNGVFQAAAVTHSSNATGIIAADFNRDGKQDIAVVNTPTCLSPCKGSVTVFPGSGSNYFNAGKTYPIGMHGSAIAAGDLNGDKILDLVVVNSVAGDTFDTSVLLGNADGTFKPARNYKLGSLSNEVYLADVNHDGRLDLFTDGGVALGKGDGTFGTRKPFPNFSFQPDMHFGIGDVNGDGKLDVVAVTSSNCTATMQALQGDGKGGFTPKAVVFEDNSNPITSMILARLRPGGPIDIVYSVAGSCFIQNGSEFDTGVAGFAGKGDGTFPTGFNVEFGAAVGDPAEIGPVVVADLNGDGKLDVGVGARNFFAVARGNGNLTFQPQQVFAASALPLTVGTGKKATIVANGIAVADFLKDGRPDVVLTSGLGVARLYNATLK